jgi:hypothetical protein
VTVPELKRAVCPGCKTDLYLHRVEDWWQCPECKWNDKPPPVKAAKAPVPSKIDEAQLTLMVNAQYTVPQIAGYFGVHSSSVKRRMRDAGLRSLNPPGATRSSLCQKGLHEMEGFNVYLDPRGGRRCKACANERDRLRRLRLAAS